MDTGLEQEALDLLPQCVPLAGHIPALGLFPPEHNRDRSPGGWVPGPVLWSLRKEAQHRTPGSLPGHTTFAPSTPSWVLGPARNHWAQRATESNPQTPASEVGKHPRARPGPHGSPRPPPGREPPQGSLCHAGWVPYQGQRGATTLRYTGDTHINGHREVISEVVKQVTGGRGFEPRQAGASVPSEDIF